VNSRTHIQLLQTGVPGLDQLLGGGIPEFSFNMIAGPSGSGKTTLAHQIMFSLASPSRRAVFFTVLGEPPLKMLRYQQQFAFFDVEKLNDSIRFCNLSTALLEENFDGVLTRIVDEVRVFSPGLVFVDSFCSLARPSCRDERGAHALERFVYQLGTAMTGWLATTFLIGEYRATEAEPGPVATVADGILALSQVVHRDDIVRKIQAVKIRGQAQSPGLHTFRIGDNGINVFPRTPVAPTASPAPRVTGQVRLSTGIVALDDMMGGGLPAGYCLLVTGPSGSGKTVLATQFLAEGARIGETGVVALFGNSPGQALDAMIDSGQVGLLDTRALGLSIDETLHDLIAMIRKLNAKRIVIDSLSSLELALAPMFREDFQASLYRVVAVLENLGVTVLMTAEPEDECNWLQFGCHGNAFLTDAIITQRYVELDGDLRRVLSVVKIRSSMHSKQIRFFDIENGRLVIGEPIRRSQTVLFGRGLDAPR
jgi:circadian clock protein KaiC